MMRALLKQEFIFTWKSLLGGLGGALAVVLLVAVVTAIPIPIADGFMLGAGIGATAVILPMALVLLAYWYWNSMYRDLGYFTMSIPVRGRTVFWAKVIYGEFVALVALAATAVAGAILVLGWAVGHRTSFGDVLGMMRDTLLGDGGMPVSVFWLIVVLAVVQVLFLVIEAAAIMSVGAEARFNSLGFGAPLIGAIIYYVAFEVITMITMLTIPFGMMMTGPDAGSFVAQGMWPAFQEAITSGSGASTAPVSFGLGFLPVWVIIVVLMAWWGSRSVDWRTSLR